MHLEILNNRCLLSVSGPDSESFLQKIITTDISKQLDHNVNPGALLSPQGKIMFDFLVSRKDKNLFFLDCRDDLADDLISRLLFYRLHAKTEILKQETQSIAVLEGSNPSYLKGNFEFYNDIRFTKLSVWRIYGNITNPSPSKGQWDQLRIQYGIAETISDFLPGNIFPHDIGFQHFGGIGFEKGCYIGQEVVSRIEHRTTPKKSVFLVSSQKTLPPLGTEILAENILIGHMGSVSGKNGLAIIGLKPLKKAVDKGSVITANGKSLSLSFPEWANS